MRDARILEMQPARLGAAALLLALAVPMTLAAPPTDEPGERRHVRSLSDGAEPTVASIDQVAWIAGSWTGTGFGGRFEEAWSSPWAGSMVGMYKHGGEDSVSLYEIQLIVEEQGTLVWKVKHFDPGFVGWEEKDGYVSFPLVEITEDTAFFDGLTIRRDGPDEMTVWLRIRSGDEVREEKLSYTRTPLVRASD